MWLWVRSLSHVLKKIFLGRDQPHRFQYFERLVLQFQMKSILLHQKNIKIYRRVSKGDERIGELGRDWQGFSN